MGKPAIGIDLTELSGVSLYLWHGRRKPDRGWHGGQRIVLAASAELENKVICVEVGADANTVSRWRRRFPERRLDGLLDEPRRAAHDRR